MQQHACTHPRPLGWGQRSKPFFSESSIVAYQINGNRTSTHSVLTHTLDPWVVVKRSKHIFFTESSHVAYQIKGNGI